MPDMFAMRVARIVLDDSLKFSYARDGGGGISEVQSALELLKSSRGMELSEAMVRQYLGGDSLDTRLFEGLKSAQRLTAQGLFPELLRQFEEFVTGSDSYRQMYMKEIGINVEEA